MLFTTNKNARLKFAAIYFLSICLLGILFISFSKVGAPSYSFKKDRLEDLQKFSLAQSLLYTGLQKLDVAYIVAITAGNDTEIAAGETVLKSRIEEVKKLSATIDNEEYRERLLKLIADAEKDNKEKKSMVKEITAFTIDPNAEDKSKNDVQHLRARLVDKDAELEALQIQIQDTEAKDKAIANLQEQLKLARGTRVDNPLLYAATREGGEWRQKHSQLKTAYDDLNVKVASLTKSYLDLAQDNKRLINQLQESRTTGNK